MPKFPSTLGLLRLASSIASPRMTEILEAQGLSMHVEVNLNMRS
jgi:hypothetical protein